MDPGTTAAWVAGVGGWVVGLGSLGVTLRLDDRNRKERTATAERNDAERVRERAAEQVVRAEDRAARAAERTEDRWSRDKQTAYAALSGVLTAVMAAVNEPTWTRYSGFPDEYRSALDTARGNVDLLAPREVQDAVTQVSIAIALYITRPGEDGSVERGRAFERMHSSHRAMLSAMRTDLGVPGPDPLLSSE